MMLNVDEMFVGFGRRAKQKIFSVFMNLRQKKVTLIKEHMMKVIVHLNKVEIVKGKIDNDTSTNY